MCIWLHPFSCPEHIYYMHKILALGECTLYYQIKHCSYIKISLESILLKIPEGYETDEKINTDLRPEESTIEDYEEVPLEQFGMAMLRGMGWKEGEGWC